MPAITINRIPAKLSKEIKRIYGSRSRFAETALAEKLTRDGRVDLAAMLQKKPATPDGN